MNLTINPINNIYKNNIRKYQNVPVEENINFTGGKKVILTKPKFSSQSMQDFSDKITNLIIRFPEMAKMQKPFVVDLNGNAMKILIDKTNKLGTKISINTNDSTNGDISLDLYLNKSGQVIKGFYCEPSSLNINFSRSDRNLRRIQFANANYMPSTEYENVWNRIKDRGFEYIYFSSADSMVFDKNDLQVFLMELAKRDTSFYAE